MPFLNVHGRKATGYGDVRAEEFADYIYNLCGDAEPYGEHRLLISILARALLDVSYRPPVGVTETRHRMKKHYGDERARRDAARYFEKGQHVSLCQLIKLDPDRVTSWVQRIVGEEGGRLVHWVDEMRVSSKRAA